MFGFSGSDLVGWILFSALGTIYFAWGKLKDLWQPKVLAVALMFFPYFINKGVWMWVVGLTLAAAIVFARD